MRVRKGEQVTGEAGDTLGSETLVALAARLKYEQAIGRRELTDDLIGSESEAHSVTPEQLRRAIKDAVLDRGDGAGPSQE